MNVFVNMKCVPLILSQETFRVTEIGGTENCPDIHNFDCVWFEVWSSEVYNTLNA